MYNCENEDYVAADLVTNDLIRMWTNLIIIFFKNSILTVIEITKLLWSVVSPSENKQVAGQLALVTGGANGLGRSIARRLAKEGCNIAIVDIDLIGAEKTAKEIELEFNVKAKAFKVDVSSYEEVLKLKNDVESSIGTVDILVNNAGLLAMMSLEGSCPQDIQKIINVNLTSHFWTCQTFLKGMIERKRGHIMATCSMVAKITYPMATAYCATKYGVDGFMNALYDELCVLDQDDFIKLTTSYPGVINTRKSFTDMLDKLGDVSPRMTPAYAADAMVNALLQNKRSIIFPFSTQIMRIVQLLPDKVMKETKLMFINHKEFLKQTK